MSVEQTTEKGRAVSVGSTDGLGMDSAPRDGSVILLLIEHRNYRYADERDKDLWRYWVKAQWIDHNGGGYCWHGLFGEPVAWKPMPPYDPYADGPAEPVGISLPNKQITNPGDNA